MTLRITAGSRSGIRALTSLASTPIRTLRSSVCPSACFSTSPANRAAAPPAPPVETLKRTPLHPIHIRPEYGAKMTPFAGFDMPLFYVKSGKQIHEHLAVRSGCGLFDVSHMVQSRITGPGATDFLSRLLPSSLSTLAPYTSTLSVMMNADGGIIDDCMLTRWGEQDYYFVTNAGRRERDLAWIRQHIQKFDAQIELLDDWALVALQGPQASAILQPLLDDKSLKLDESLFFSQSIHAEISGARVHIARGGYTGEDGFEISIPPGHAESITSLLIDQPGVTLAGLAARDSLRLEAGLCLYGVDLDETVGVGEAGLGWVVGKERTGFLGEQRTRKEVGTEIKRRRVGLEVEAGSPARAHSQLSGSKKRPIGVVTSGIPSPSLQQNIAMGYVIAGFHAPGSHLKVTVRGKERVAKVVKMPFVPAKYHRAPKV